jgi:hypothetical protein
VAQAGQLLLLVVVGKSEWPTWYVHLCGPCLFGHSSTSALEPSNIEMHMACMLGCLGSGVS